MNPTEKINILSNDFYTIHFEDKFKLLQHKIDQIIIWRIFSSDIANFILQEKINIVIYVSLEGRQDEKMVGIHFQPLLQLVRQADYPWRIYYVSKK